jgi:quinol monooxygenase YgiN
VLQRSAGGIAHAREQEELMTPAYAVIADFHVRADAIGVMKQVIDDVTRPSLSEDGCQIYHWSQGAEDQALFLLYMEWRDKAAFDAHVASPHVQNAERRIANEKLLTKPAGEWHFYRLYPPS